MDGKIAKIIRGLGEVMFPRNDRGIPDYQITELENRTLAYLKLLSPFTRLSLVLLYFGAEYVFPLLSWRPGRMSHMSPSKRLKILSKLKTANSYYIRSLTDGLKANLTMIYMSHPSVSNYIGEYKTCINPEDSFQINIKKKK